MRVRGSNPLAPCGVAIHEARLHCASSSTIQLVLSTVMLRERTKLPEVFLVDEVSPDYAPLPISPASPRTDRSNYLPSGSTALPLSYPRPCDLGVGFEPTTNGLQRSKSSLRIALAWSTVGLLALLVKPRFSDCRCNRFLAGKSGKSWVQKGKTLLWEPFGSRSFFACHPQHLRPVVGRPGFEPGTRRPKRSNPFPAHHRSAN